MPLFGVFQLLVSHGDELLGYLLLLSQFLCLIIFLFLGVTAEFLLGWIFNLYLSGMGVGRHDALPIFVRFAKGTSAATLVAVISAAELVVAVVSGAGHCGGAAA